MGPAESSKLLPKITEEVLSTAKHLNKCDALLLLLTIEDAYDNLNNEVLQKYMFNRHLMDDLEEVHNIARLRHIQQFFYVYTIALGLCLEYAKEEPRTINSSHEMKIAFGPPTPDFVKAAIFNGYI